MIRKTFYIILLFSLIVSTSFSRPGATWLEIGAGGRAAGLAGTMTASVAGPTSTYWNPAAVGIKNGVEIMYADNYEGSKSQYISGDFKLQSSGRFAMGFSILHVSSGDLEHRTGPSTEPDGLFEARQYALGATISYKIPSQNLRFGVSGRYLSDAIYIYHGSGWSMDFGLLRQNLFNDFIDFGLTARHIGQMNALHEEAYDLPATFTGGIKAKLPEISNIKPAIMLEADKVVDIDVSFRSAVELGIYEIIDLRGGYMTGIEGTELTYGFGLKWKSWTFDYGYIPFEYDNRNSQRLSIGVAW